MGEKAVSKLPPLKEAYKLTEENELILKRFGDELHHRLGGVSVTFEVYKENFLAYPSVHADTIKFEVTVGNWRRVSAITEVELDIQAGGSFYYFCRRISDDVTSDLLKIGAARA